MKFFKNLSIATKIVSVAAVLAAIFLSVPIIYILQNVRAHITKDHLQTLHIQTEVQADSIQAGLAKVSEAVLFLSKTPPIQGMLGGDIKKQTRLPWRVLCIMTRC